jgi:hypothetical protein
MIHHVFWFPDADKKLQEIVAETDDKDDLALVIKKLDRWLSRFPQDVGESRFENVRLGFLPPLGILFEILENPPTVIVVDVWRTDRK